MENDRAARLRGATEKRSRDTLARVNEVLQTMASAGESLTVAQVAAAAHVSRSWIYTQPALLERIAQIVHQDRGSHQRAAAQQRASTASLLRRLELTHQRIAHLTIENDRLREQLARSYGARRSNGD
jgi:hypothetical protein